MKNISPKIECGSQAENYTKDLKGKKSNKLPINCLYRQYFNTQIPSIEEDQFKI